MPPIDERPEKLLAQFGFVRMSAEAIVEKRISAAFFPHGLGHLLGLQVHDVGGHQAGRDGGTIPVPDGHPFLRLTRKLEPRQVLTIEPGLYFIASLLDELRRGPYGKHVDWDKVERFSRYGGIRIEDNVAVTETAPENMTRDAFATLAQQA